MRNISFGLVRPIHDKRTIFARVKLCQLFLLAVLQPLHADEFQVCLTLYICGQMCLAHSYGVSQPNTELFTMREFLEL